MAIVFEPGQLLCRRVGAFGGMGALLISAWNVRGNADAILHSRTIELGLRKIARDLPKD